MGLSLTSASTRTDLAFVCKQPGAWKRGNLTWNQLCAGLGGEIRRETPGSVGLAGRGGEILPGFGKPQADGEPLPEEIPRLMEEARPTEKPSRGPWSIS